MIAIPSVPMISTYTPNWATRPITFAPVMFRAVWIASRMHGDPQDRPVVGRVEVPAEPVVGQARDVADDPGVDRGDGDQQRDPVEPADEPAVGRADRELAVLVERAGDGVVAGELAEHERDEEHPDDRDPA